jgi:uncharacterized protein YutE (UPF0331/DUF86 family)
MKLDLDVIRGRIQFIEDNLELLESLAAYRFDEFKDDFRNVEAAKHLLQVAIESMLDICTHIVARLRLGVPNDDRETLALLRDRDLLPATHVATYQAMNSLRNRIVHLYHDVDPQEIHRILREDLDDFRMFIADVQRIVAKQQSGPSTPPLE